MEEKAVTRYNAGAIIEQVIIQGDLGKLAPADRVSYYTKVCESVGLNPFTKPFEYIVLNGRLTLYARKDATDQLRKLHGVSIDAPKVEHVEGMIIVTVTARDTTGRIDSDMGVVAIDALKGDARANAIMKSITKAKRRVTLSICGLGMLDETEIETIPSARLAPVNVHVETPQASTTNGNSQQKKVSREDLEKLWQNKLWPKAQVLGIEVEPISPNIETQELARRCKELHQAIKEAEAAIPAGANP